LVKILGELRFNFTPNLSTFFQPFLGVMMMITGFGFRIGVCHRRSPQHVTLWHSTTKRRRRALPPISPFNFPRSIRARRQFASLS
jgi:hypothetical protein